jgi:hypothetical protein
VSLVEPISSSFDFIAIIIFGKPFMLRSFRMGNQNEKLLIGSK